AVQALSILIAAVFPHSVSEQMSSDDCHPIRWRVKTLRALYILAQK
ncbi:hypothetical protein CEXT_611541, partial [Caerostris extrusa]